MQYKHLSICEREKIQELLWQKVSIRNIGKALGRSHSSILRELKGRVFQYTPRLAEERARLRRKSRGRKDRLKNEKIREYVISHLKAHWSPEQISGRMNKEEIGSISHEAIYQFIYAEIHRDGYGYVKPGHEDLRMYLRRKRKRRVKKGMRKCQRILKPYGISIDERPLIANQRERIGDWESDTVESCDHKPGVNTLVERKTGLVLITKLKTKASVSTICAIKERMKTFPPETKKTMTFDNGPENQNWRLFEKVTNIKSYFAHPYHSWERGTNENTNGLIREYFPKKTDFTRISDEEILKVEYDLNTRPRKRLNWSTPLEVISGALTG